MPIEFDDPVKTVSYSIQSREKGSTRWKTAGRSWSKFDKAIDYGHQMAALRQIETVRMQKTETTVETIWQTGDKPQPVPTRD